MAVKKSIERKGNVKNYETYLLYRNKKYYRNGHHIHSFLCLSSNYLIDTNQVIKLHGFYNCKERGTVSLYTTLSGVIFYIIIVCLYQLSLKIYLGQTSCNNSILLHRYVIRMIFNFCFR